jgi:DNA-binding response OmpR family regulator
MKDAKSSRVEDPANTALQSQTNPPEHILVVDDDLFLRRLNIKALVSSGYEVDAAADGAVAWQALNTDSYDLLITENNLPKASGVEVLKKLRAARMVLPVIMATGTLPNEEFTLYPWLQPAATLLKPYTSEEMLRMVKEVLCEADSTADGSKILTCDDMKDNKTSRAGGPTSASRHRPTRATHRILVVDEASDLRRLYAEVLAGFGYCVDAAADGAAGWQALKANRYDLLITEQEMPNLTGLELVKMLRAARMALPVVMAAGRLPTHELVRNPSLRLAATLLKPFAVDALVDTVNNLLRVTDTPREQIAPQEVSRTQPSADGLRL